MSSPLALVTLVVPDYDEAISFYVGALGFDLREDTALADGKRWVVVGPPEGGAGLLLARAANDAQRARIGAQTGGRVAFFLHTSDSTPPQPGYGTQASRSWRVRARRSTGRSRCSPTSTATVGT